MMVSWPSSLGDDRPVTGEMVLRRTEHQERLTQTKNGTTQYLTEGFKLRSQPRDSHLLDLGQTKAKSASDGTKGVTICHRMDG